MLHINKPELHRQLFALAIPMILSNITVPLLGLVDAAVMGHLEHSYYLGGATVGAMIVTFIVWLCGFLRMSTTGLSAQAYGSEKPIEGFTILLRGILVALFLALIVIVFQSFYLKTGLYLAGGSEQVQFYARQYSEIRIWGMPASLTNLVILGWLLGNHKAKSVMWVLICTNLVNVLLDVYFVLVLDWQVQGVALATLISEYTGMALGIFFVIKTCQSKGLTLSVILQTQKDWFERSALGSFFRLNRDILIRTLCLEICFVFMTFQGARLGDDIVAANAILMNFLLLISFGLDGIANAAEALVGQAKGAKNARKLQNVVSVSLVWTLIFASIFALFFAIAGHWLISLITTIESVVTIANIYLPWMILLPLVACWCFLFDGVYVGLMQANVMRNSMIIATFFCFFPVWMMLSSYGNHGLWAAFCCFMFARGVTLAWHYFRYNRHLHYHEV